MARPCLAYERLNGKAGAGSFSSPSGQAGRFGGIVALRNHDRGRAGEVLTILHEQALDHGISGPKGY